MSRRGSTARMPRLAGAVMRTQPDRRLAELAGEDSRPAFEELVNRHRARLVAYAAGIAPPSAADDVVQDSMLKAHTALRRGDRPEFPKAWLFKIVRNTALNHRRGYRAHEELDESIDGVEQPPDAAERNRRFGALMVALDGLPPAQRDAIVQRELEGRGHEEIASSMGVSTGAVRQLIHRARTSLRAGVAALVPMSLVRLIALPGAAEPVAGGLGATAAKVGVGAVLATAAVLGGDEVPTQPPIEGGEGPAVATAAASPGAAEAATQGGSGAKSESGPDAATEVAKREDPDQGAPTQPHPRDQQQPPPAGGGGETYGGGGGGGGHDGGGGYEGGGGSGGGDGGQQLLGGGGGLPPAP